jgi:hypothetical protein
VSIDITGFNSFRNKIQRLNSLSTDDIAMAIAKKGRDLAEEYYASANVTVSVESNGNHASVIASGDEHLLYLEYGTGIVGEASTERGEPPNRPFDFFSRNQIIHLDTWTYNYWKKLHPEADDWIGFAPRAGMWKSARDLRQGKAKEAVIELINRED